MKNILFGGESDGENIGGVKKLALGAAAAALVWDSSNDRDEYPKTAAAVFGIPLNNVARYARGGDVLCALLLPARIVYQYIKQIEDDELNSRARGEKPADTVDSRLDRELDTRKPTTQLPQFHSGA